MPAVGITTAPRTRYVVAGSGSFAAVSSRPRTSKSATSRPASATTIPATNAARKPSVALPVVEVATAVRAAMPTAPPICWEVLIRPEARPASEGYTPASAAIEIGTIVKPIPTATMRNPGSRSPR